jgi:hypothetical protein
MSAASSFSSFSRQTALAALAKIISALADRQKALAGTIP